MIGSPGETIRARPSLAQLAEAGLVALIDIVLCCLGYCPGCQGFPVLLGLL